MKKPFINSILLVITSFFLTAQSTASFKEMQLKHSRVRNAYLNKQKELENQLKNSSFAGNDYEVFIRVFKHEQQLELWLKMKNQEEFKKFKTYAICASSGVLGPKRKQGDGQVPEGFYEIAHFNPASSYHLSLKVNYPNKSDMKKAGSNPGGDIMIHGECVTIGCVPIENAPMEEVYLLCLESKNRGHAIKTHFFPYRFNDKNTEGIKKKYPPEMIEFWESLQQGFMYFEKHHKLPVINIDKNGNYNLLK